MSKMTHAKFHFNWLMLTLILVSPPPLPAWPGKQLKRLDLIRLTLFHPRGPFSPPSMKNFNNYQTSAGIKLTFCDFLKFNRVSADKKLLDNV